MWNPEPPPLPLLSPVRFPRVLAFSPASATPNYGYVHLAVSPPPCLGFSPACPPFIPKPRIRNHCFRPRVRPEEKSDAHFRFRSVPLGVRVLWVSPWVPGCIPKHGGGGGGG